MKKFITNILKLLVLLIIILATGWFLPATPRASKSLLFAKIKKDSLLQNTLNPRIIFVGGSNLSFGLNSNIIKDSLKLNPVNTAIHASIGLQHMMDNTIQYIKENDVVVLSPEYSHFYGQTVYGGEELIRTVAHVKFLKLDRKQIFNVYKYLPKLFLTRLNPFEYFNFKESDVYSVNSYNNFGDVYKHWALQKRKFQPENTFKTQYNPNTIKLINNFRLKLKEKKAKLYITYPCYQESSFENNVKQIKKIELELSKYNFKTLGTPERYRFNDSLMFNTPYHLSKNGLYYRTQLLIEDIKKAPLTDYIFPNVK